MTAIETAKQILYGNSYPKPLKELTYKQGADLCIEVRGIRDSINRLLTKYYNFSEVRDLPVHKQLDMLQALVLISTLKEADDADTAQKQPSPPIVKRGGQFSTNRYSVYNSDPGTSDDGDSIPF